MSLTTPTTKDVADNIIAQLEATLNQTIPLLPKSFLRVVSTVFAAVFIVLYKYGGFMFQQIFVSTASDVDTDVNGVILNPLVEWGRLIGIGDPAPATQAELLIDITVETQVGSLPGGSQLVSAVTGVTYITLGDVLLDAATVQATIRAVNDQAGGGGAGSIGNLDPGAVVSFANPLANVARDAVVDSQTVTGADGETTAEYRARVIDRFQALPQGGAYADYRLWAEEPAGLINAYPYTSAVCPGQVDVYIEATEASSGSPDGIPTLAQLQEALDSIELDSAGLATRRPANALANTFAIIRTGFDVAITGLVVDNQATVQAQVETALDEYFLGREPFIVGLSIPPRVDRITSTSVGGVIDDVVAAAGGIFASFALTLGGFDVVTYPVGTGEKAKLSSVSFL